MITYSIYLFFKFIFSQAVLSCIWIVQSEMEHIVKVENIESFPLKKCNILVARKEPRTPNERSTKNQNHEKSKTKRSHQEKSENRKHEINFEIQKYGEFEKMARNLSFHHVLYGHCWELTNHVFYRQIWYKMWNVKVGNLITNLT